MVDAAENFEHSLAAEEFQPALRVGYFTRDHAADNRAEGEGGQPPGKPSPCPMFGTRDIAGAEDDVRLAAADPLVALLQGRELEGEIGVGEGQHAAGGAEHGNPHGASLSALRNNPQRRATRIPISGVSAAVQSVLPSSATNTR